MGKIVTRKERDRARNAVQQAFNRELPYRRLSPQEIRAQYSGSKLEALIARAQHNLKSMSGPFIGMLSDPLPALKTRRSWLRDGN